MADFKIAIKPVLLAEGGYVNDPSDSGGETYRGISRKNFPKWAGWSIVDAHKPLHKGDIINDSTLDMLVNEFYISNFWNKIQGDHIINQDTANELLDSSVNMGITRAIILSQKGFKIAETGRMDQLTLTTINKFNNYA